MAVGDYDLKPFTLPVGEPKATQSRNNDNLLRTKFVAHQADTVAHVTSGTLANRPVTADTGTLYLTTDTAAAYLYNGSGWVTLTSNGGNPTWSPELVEVVWGTPGAESGNAIEVSASSYDITGASLSTDEIGVMVIVTDGAADTEPSATATISAASVPVGTLVGGAGTATAVFKTNASGNFAVRVSEPTSGSRYLWVRAGGHFQRFVKARDGVLQLTYTTGLLLQESGSDIVLENATGNLAQEQ